MGYWLTTHFGEDYGVPRDRQIFIGDNGRPTGAVRSYYSSYYERRKYSQAREKLGFDRFFFWSAGSGYNDLD